MTAVEWLLEHLERNIMWTDKAENIAEQAKEMEKVQIMNAFISGYTNGVESMIDGDLSVPSPEDYYNQTYKNENNNRHKG